MAIQTIHPHVTQVDGVVGGKPVITGTRTPVRSIAAYHPPHLSLAQIYDALSFYYDHQAELDADIEANREEYVRRTCNP